MTYKTKFARGKNCKLFSDNIFDHDWEKTGKTTQEKDHFHNVKVTVEWYTVEYPDGKKEFGCCEVAPDQYMFLY